MLKTNKKRILSILVVLAMVIPMTLAGVFAVFPDAASLGTALSFPLDTLTYGDMKSGMAPRGVFDTELSTDPYNDFYKLLTGVQVVEFDYSLSGPVPNDSYVCFYPAGGETNEDLYAYRAGNSGSQNMFIMRTFYNDTAGRSYLTFGNGSAKQNGSHCDAQVLFEPDVTYHIRAVLDLPNKKFDVWVGNVKVASQYDFYSYNGAAKTHPNPSRIAGLTTGYGVNDTIAGTDIEMAQTIRMTNLTFTPLTKSADQAAAVTSNIANGTYATPQNVVLSSATEGATIYYTTDGTTPTINSPKFTGMYQVALDKAVTIKAIAVRYDMQPSNVATYQISVESPKVSAITANTPSGSYTDPFDVSLSCAMAGVTIYYTDDGSEPDDINGIEYEGPISISSTTTIKAKGYKDGKEPSDVSTFLYEFPSATPEITSSTLTVDTVSNLISGADVGTTIQTFVDALLAQGGTIAVYNKAGNLITDYTGKIGTGWKIKLLDASQEVLLDYTVAIFGDISGDGQLTNADATQALFAVSYAVTLTPDQVKGGKIVSTVGTNLTNADATKLMFIVSGLATLR